VRSHNHSPPKHSTTGWLAEATIVECLISPAAKQIARLRRREAHFRSAKRFRTPFPVPTYGESDELAMNVAKDPVHVRDFQATVLHLLGIDHERLTFKHQGRRYRLTDVHGKVVNGVLA